MTTFTSRAIDARGSRFSYGERGEGEPTLILHSLLTNRRAYEAMGEALDGRIVTLDLPGFGSTDVCPPDINSFADRVAQFIREMKLDKGLTLVGNGMGAFVALGTAIYHGPLLDRLILVGCGVRFPDQAKRAFAEMIDTVRSGGIEAVVPIALRRIFTESFLGSNPDLAEKAAAALRKTEPSTFINACEALTTVDYTSQAEDVRTPTLVLVGEEDQATPPSLAEQVHSLIPGSRLETLPGIAHAPHLQDPEGLSAAIERFQKMR